MGQATAAGRVAAFLDRDGVLNEAVLRGGKPRPPASVGDLVIRPGVRAACASLRNLGVLLLVVTNQPDVARGTATRDEVDAINQHLTAELGLDAVLVCPHDDADGCDCRKPGTGLALQAKRDHPEIDFARSVVVGDKGSDITLGKAIGAVTVMLGSGERQEGGLSTAADCEEHDLHAFALSL